MKHSIWKAYHSFSTKERAGILTLLSLTAIFLSTPYLFDHSLPENVDTTFLKEVQIFREGLSQDTIVAVKRKHRDTIIPKKRLKIDINKADSATWESLNGIGPVLAARIVRFRDKLGGFYAISQVKETYGLPDSTFKKIQPYLQLNTVSLKIIDLNQADEQTLAQHPYIRYKLARLIVLYRSNNGPFSQPTDLLGIPLVDDSIYRKIEHYIKTEKPPV